VLWPVAGRRPCSWAVLVKNCAFSHAGKVDSACKRNVQLSVWWDNGPETLQKKWTDWAGAVGFARRPSGLYYCLCLPC
jgi:hypothetical protein